MDMSSFKRKMFWKKKKIWFVKSRYASIKGKENEIGLIKNQICFCKIKRKRKRKEIRFVKNQICFWENYFYLEKSNMFWKVIENEIWFVKKSNLFLKG